MEHEKQVVLSLVQQCSSVVCVICISPLGGARWCAVSRSGEKPGQRQPWATLGNPESGIGSLDNSLLFALRSLYCGARGSSLPEFFATCSHRQNFHPNPRLPVFLCRGKA